LVGQHNQHPSPVVEDHVRVGEGFVAAVEIPDRRPQSAGAAALQHGWEMSKNVTTHNFGKNDFIVTI